MTTVPSRRGGARAPRLRVIVAGGTPAMRRAARDALASDRGLLVIADARDAVETLELARYYRPDVVLIDERLPPAGAAAIVAELTLASGAAALVRSSGELPDSDLAALLAGAAGVVWDPTAPQALARALRDVAGGGAALPPALAMRLIQRLRRASEGGGLRPVRSPLTRREWEVLDLICAGASTREIAHALRLGEETVYGHVKRMLRKLGVRSRAEAVTAAELLRAGSGAQQGSESAGARSRGPR
jgi:DNA-binding NarL/FixJ family response regulator